MNETRKRWWPHRVGLLVLVVLVPLIAVATLVLARPWLRPSDPLDGEAPITRQIHDFCTACHAYPPPDSFPQWAWEREVLQGYRFAREFQPDLPRPPFEEVLHYYQSRAPAELELPRLEPAPTPPPVRFQPRGDGQPPQEYATANVNLVHLSDPRRLDVLACDMRRNVVKLLRPSESPWRWQVLAEAPHPVHTQVVDLDGDGIKDVLVACLGAFPPTDALCGKVLWLRGDRAGRFTPVTLLEGVGRVTDVRAADFNGDGKFDLVVAVFGWRRTGEIILLENRTTDPDKPVFVRHRLDSRHGTIHVPVCDLNNDGKPDFVALLSQEHETVVAFLNEGGFRFRKEVIYKGPHPAYGSSGIQLVDLDGDGDLDVLYTNGDSLDTYLLRADHGAHWLENRGSFPFTHHRLTTMFGANRAVAADFDGDGDKDVLVVSFLPQNHFPEQQNLDAVVLLEQVAPGRFVRHSLERGQCNHPTCAAGDLFGEGRMDFVTGNFLFSRKVTDSITLWRNQGQRRPGARPGHLRTDQ